MALVIRGKKLNPTLLMLLLVLSATACFFGLGGIIVNHLTIVNSDALLAIAVVFFIVLCYLVVRYCD
ncbi:MAG: hypothetical protein QMC78_04980 [Methanocellales archaeon]|nr:hypothetical protein [Methanocellales archaeon]